MEGKTDTIAQDIRLKLAESGGLTAQELGFGRIAGQVLVYLYLSDGESSLDQIEGELGLSKAAVSIAARQLENLGLLRRIYRKGNRKRYYRTADNIGQALQEGLLGVLRRKVDAVAGELDEACKVLSEHNRGEDPELRFLDGRVQRAKVLRDRAAALLNSRLLRFLTG